MNNIRERAITQSDNTRSRLATIKLVHLLFISSLVGLFSLSTSAAERVGSKVKRYFIYSHYQRDPASDFIQISHDVARAETELMRNKLGLPRKIQIKILGSYKQKTLSSRKPTTLINNF